MIENEGSWKRWTLKRLSLKTGARFCVTRGIVILSLGAVWSSVVFKSIRVARLQNEVGTEDCLSYTFSYQKCSEIFPKLFEPLFCRAGPKGVSTKGAFLNRSNFPALGHLIQ